MFRKNWLLVDTKDGRTFKVHDSYRTKGRATFWADLLQPMTRHRTSGDYRLRVVHRDDLARAEQGETEVYVQ